MSVRRCREIKVIFFDGIIRALFFVCVVVLIFLSVV